MNLGWFSDGVVVDFGVVVRVEVFYYEVVVFVVEVSVVMGEKWIGEC